MQLLYNGFNITSLGDVSIKDSREFEGGEQTQRAKVRLDVTLLHADLGVVYESTGVTDPAAVRTEAIAVLTAVLKAQPVLRQNFHGLWAYTVKDGKRTPVLEVPMAQIP